MKTTDSVMRELNKEIEDRLQMIPHPDDRRKFRGLIQRIRTADKRVYSHSLAEARREGKERGFEMGEKSRVETIKKMQTMEGRWLQAVLEVGGQKLADKVLHAKSWTKSDLLTGDNPERKV